MDLPLTPYDEFPVHQAAQPFSYVPVTDYSWDDGYFFGVFSPDDGIYVAIGMRVNPNSDMVGGYALLNENGHQVTFRFNRCWRRSFDLRVGPFSIEIVEPLKTIRLSLAENDSGLSFDLLWHGVCPPYLEPHHVATSRGRTTTDQRRYSQPGVAEGSIDFRGRHFDVTPDRWGAARDHSWGLYAERPPLAPVRSLLPPAIVEGPQRAMRLWVCYRTDHYQGFLNHHETAEGLPVATGDVFSGLFNGNIYEGWSERPPTVMKSLQREFSYRAGTRVLDAADLIVTDVEDRLWRFRFDIAALPWIPQTTGYTPGSWKDGGSFATYHGSEELVTEWDELDATEQPFEYRPYVVEGEAARDSFGMGTELEKINGIEYQARFTLTDPTGDVHHGSAHVEHFIRGPYDPYGFK